MTSRYPLPAKRTRPDDFSADDSDDVEEDDDEDYADDVSDSAALLTDHTATAKSAAVVPKCRGLLPLLDLLPLPP